MLCALYLLAGQWGHDPWKHEDAIHIGVAWQMAHAGHWLTPQLAGQPWLEQPPLWYWTAALLGQWLSPLLPFHDGARLASAFYGALFLFAITGAARALALPAIPITPLLAIGCLGLLIPLHEAQPASAQLATLAVFYWGLTESRPRLAAMLLTTAIAGGFLAGGLFFLLLSLPLLPLLRSNRSESYLALLLGALPIALWPLASETSANHFSAWWQAERLRLLSLPMAPQLDHLELLSWAAWPLWPLAGWALWVHGRPKAKTTSNQEQDTGLKLPLAALGLAGLLFLLRDPRPLAILPLLPALILLAASAADRLRRGAASALDWFAIMSFSLFIALIWLGALAMLSGWPPKIARNFARLVPGYVSEFDAVLFIFALAVTGLWIALLRLPRSPWRPMLRWAAGVTALWAVMMALWLPWIDYGKSYRPVVAEVRAQLPSEPGCVAGRNLNLAMIASLDYFAGLQTRHDARDCAWLLVLGNAQSEPQIHGWSLQWQGHRPGDKSERLRLYRRLDGADFR